jgi:uncharacterized protein (TIGR03437 family)
MTSDATGNIYVAGTTSSPDLLVKNAAQPSIGEALLMRSLDRGQTWQKVPGPPASPITITPHPSDPQTLFIGATDGVYKTADGGKTWRHVFRWAPPALLDPAAGSFVNIAIDPANPLNVYVYNFGARPFKFLASGDGGDSWQRRDTPAPITYGPQGTSVLWVDPNGSGTVGLGVWLSKDHGMTWVQTAPPPGTTGVTFTVPDPHQVGWIYAADSAGSSGHLYLSKDWGNTWTETGDPSRVGDSETEAIQDLLFDPDLAARLYAADSNDLDISVDGGASWQAYGQVFLDSGKRLALLSRQCGGGGLLVVEFSSIVSSLDFGSTWQPAQLSRVLDLATGPGCAVYAVRSMSSDVFVAKLAPGGNEVLWSTFLGGSDLDASAAIALDAQGNVYVAGITASTDFPTTAPRIGPVGRQNVFAATYDPAGRLIYSVVFGGESADVATALAVNADAEAHLVGWTNSKSFPATRGAFETKAGDADGFAVKLAADGSMVYASYLPDFAISFFNELSLNPPLVVAVAAEKSGTALIGGTLGMLSRMSADGSSLTALPAQPGPIFAMETDGRGNIYIAGQESGPDTGSGQCFEGYFDSIPSTLLPGDIFLNKLQPDNLQQVFSARLFGACQSWPGTVKIGSTGEVTLGLWTFGSFPMRSPVLPVSTCGGGPAVVSRLSADGSSLLFSSYLDMCASAPPLALAPDGSIYAGTSPLGAEDRVSNAADILRIPLAQPGAPSLDGAFNAFNGDPAYVIPGMLVTLTGQQLAPQFINLGFYYPNGLPTELGGVQVLFDGFPAQILEVAGDHVICVAPTSLGDSKSVTVQVVNGAQASFAVPLTVASLGTGFLTYSYPAFPPTGSVDGNIRNADGTLNNPQNPAPPGSTVTLFATGLTAPGVVPLLWNAPPPQSQYPPPYFFLSGNARHMPGFIDAIWAVDFQIPDAPGDGVYVVPVSGVLTRFEIGYVGSGLGVYVR